MFAALFVALPGNAQITKGAGFMKECTQQPPDPNPDIEAINRGARMSSEVACSMYAFGLFDGIQLAPGIAAGQLLKPQAVKLTVCARQPVTAVELRDIIVRYIRAHPEQLNFETSMLALFAFEQAFPCSSN